jgi:serine protease Do
MASALVQTATLARLMPAALLLGLIACPAAAADDQRLAQAVERARQATVGILDSTPDARQSGYEARFSLRGTGVHLRDGFILTARHAVERSEGGQTVLPKRIMILTQELHELPATLVGGSAYLDLALYQLEPPSALLMVTMLPFAGSESTAGQDVFTVGYPLGWGPVITFGRMGNPNTFLPTVDTRLLQTTLASCNGNSGGGLFNAEGELVGIMHAVIKTESTPGEQGCSPLAFAVPGGLVKKVADALMKGEKPGFAKLGIQLTAIKDGSRWRAAVGKVFEPAQSGGVQKGDVLLAIDGTEIRDAAHLKNYLMERTVPGQTVTLRVRRGGKDVTLKITLGEG